MSEEKKPLDEALQVAMTFVIGHAWSSVREDPDSAGGLAFELALLLSSYLREANEMRAALEDLLEYVEAKVEPLRYKGVTMLDDRVRAARRALGR